MPPLQQRFWPDPQPLVERLGRDFFRRVPACPGVYLMHGAADAVLYVGKAKSLRHRLGSYRVANPERMARRTLRLLRLVERIAWEECPDEAAALRREAELLLALKPRFNRAGVWRGPDRFLAWRGHPDGLELAVTFRPEAGWFRFGPLGAQATHLHRALVRLLWCRFHPGLGLSAMPAGWLTGRHGPQVILRCGKSETLHEGFHHLVELFQGRVELFQQWLLPATTLLEQQVQEEDVTFLCRSLISHQPGRDRARFISISQSERVSPETMPGLPTADWLPPFGKTSLVESR